MGFYVQRVAPCQLREWLLDLLTTVMGIINNFFFKRYMTRIQLSFHITKPVAPLWIWFLKKKKKRKKRWTWRGRIRTWRGRKCSFLKQFLQALPTVLFQHVVGSIGFSNSLRFFSLFGKVSVCTMLWAQKLKRMTLLYGKNWNPPTFMKFLPS